MSKEYKFVSAVIYMHNEQKNIQTYLGIVHKFLKEHFTKYEIICVDDASSDDSVKKIHDLVKKDNLDNISLISMSIFQGRELGMEAGVDLSIGDYVYELEWIDMFDTKTYENKLWEAYNKAVEGFDIVIFSSANNKGIGSFIFYNLYNKSNLSYTELTPERFRLVTRRAINRVSRMNKSIVYRKALYANSGLKISVIGDRKLKESYKKKDVSKNKSKTGISVLLAYTGLVPKIVMTMEMLLIFLLIISIIKMFFAKGDISDLFTQIVVLFVGAVVGGIELFITKYCELLLELVLKREKYTVSSIEKLVNSEDKE